jgi:hypothetical protein
VNQLFFFFIIIIILYYFIFIYIFYLIIIIFTQCYIYLCFYVERYGIPEELNMKIILDEIYEKFGTEVCF